MANTMTSVEKTHENKMRRYAERQGYLLIKSPRRDPRARGFGTYILAKDDRLMPGSEKDPAAVAEAHLRMDRGEGLTLTQVERELHYGDEQARIEAESWKWDNE